jgi:type I restriction-modification system DNA methylase subunit
MAEMILEKQELPVSSVLQISDPCCGAGGMLIAAASVMKKIGFDYQQNALFIAQDIDARCARMAFIQLSLLGAPAVIICGDSLVQTCCWQRETVGCLLAGMDYRL